MKYIALKNNKFTEVVYEELNKNILDWVESTIGITILAVPYDFTFEEGETPSKEVLEASTKFMREYTYERETDKLFIQAYRAQLEGDAEKFEALKIEAQAKVDDVKRRFPITEKAKGK